MCSGDSCEVLGDKQLGRTDPAVPENEGKGYHLANKRCYDLWGVLATYGDRSGWALQGSTRVIAPGKVSTEETERDEIHQVGPLLGSRGRILTCL